MGGAPRRAATLALAAGETERSLELLDIHDRNHGESPESAFRRGKSLRSAGRRDEAMEAFGRVGDLARNAARYQRGEAQSWALRAFFARLL